MLTVELYPEILPLTSFALILYSASPGPAPEAFEISGSI